ncbi:hypothetical protein PR202_gb09022 [Eleusine coracana subsp. coracana]|uniref:Uncharacterized protein n=1 Tax=Eleusine coracana subsp. coracana TaxID=191504 RepID=A0AAV5EDU2_ELECO|nr:hypothetical protein PR202_gb09022 [Eleusine coracana subsp. coracana]
MASLAWEARSGKAAEAVVREVVSTWELEKRDTQWLAAWDRTYWMPLEQTKRWFDARTDMETCVCLVFTAKPV